MRTARDYVVHGMDWKVADPARVKIERDLLLYRRRKYAYGWSDFRGTFGND